MNKEQKSLAQSATDEKVSTVSEKFDLLCEQNGKLVRLPFVEGKNKNPVGIFPLKDSNIAFELEETNKTFRKNADENRLPETDWCKMVFPLQKELKLCFEALEKPVLQGGYFAKTTNNSINLIVTFVRYTDNCKHSMPIWSCESYMTARIRYVINFKQKAKQKP